LHAQWWAIGLNLNPAIWEAIAGTWWRSGMLRGLLMFEKKAAREDGACAPWPMVIVNRLADYCLSNTCVCLTVLPSLSVPLLVTVAVFPS
jgi:hypothetical protein